MQRSIRVLTAAFAIAVASLAGALYLGHERAVHDSGASLGVSGANLASLDISALLGDPKTADRRMLDEAFHKLEYTYYKPFSAQVLVTGERRGLLAALKRLHASDATIPALVANGDEAHDLALVDKNLSTAEARFPKLGAATQADLTQSAIRGMMSSLGDPYTVYLSAKEINSLEESLKGGDFGGIGVYIVQDPRNKHILVEPIEGTPAYLAGIKTGDEIVRVAGVLARTLPLDDVERRIRGPIGTRVALQVRSRGKAPRTVGVTRRQILVPSVHAKMEDGFDYVRLSDFGSTSYDEVRKAFLDGKTKHAKGYILDLRNNGGGLLDAAVQISSLFIADGTIVSTIDRAGDKESKPALGTSIGTAPLVLLVNKYTASASEITAGAVQDDRVGTLIGTKTFGKGVVQSIVSLPDGAALKITTARYVTPLGRDIHHKGIQPDIHVDQTAELPIIDTPADVQLAAAKRFLRSKAAAGTSPAQ